MEDILNKWTTELNRYHTEFQRVAVDVGKWDQMIIQNGAQIYNLNSQIEETEKIQKEIDTNLEYIENQQTELSSILNEYEEKILELANGSNNDPRGKLNPADEERESAYNTAENLNKQLDDLGNTLSDMIKEINSTKGGVEDDDSDENTIGQIVKILNRHLCSLQWIDQSTTELGLQIQELSRLNDTATIEQERIQKLTKRTSHNGLGFDNTYSRFGNSTPNKNTLTKSTFGTGI
jgi:nuclear pore complex protein Nup62